MRLHRARGTPHRTDQGVLVMEPRRRLSAREMLRMPWFEVLAFGVRGASGFAGASVVGGEVGEAFGTPSCQDSWSLAGKRML